MADKSLSELEWKKFAKGRGMKELPLGKAFAALELAKDPAAELAALDEIEKQSDVLLKAHKGDKEIKDYLTDVGKAADKQRKLSEVAAKKAEKEAAKEAEQEASESEGEEEGGSELLTSKMVPLLRQIKTGEVAHAMIATTGKDLVVLLSRRPIGPPRRKLLTDKLGVTGGVKFIVGQCIWEENAHTFVVQSQAAGLAKKLKAALLEQTEQRCKVRVRGEDGVVDDDGEAAEQVEGGESRGSQESRESESQEPQANPEAAQLKAALAKMMPLAQQAIAANPASRAEIMAALTGFQELMKAGDYAKAKLALMQVGKLLQALKAGGDGGGGKAKASAPSKPVAPLWEKAGEEVMDQVTALVVNMRQAGDPELDRMADDILETLGSYLDELGDTLEDYDELEGPERESMADEALGLVTELRKDIAGDDLIKAMDSHPKVKLKVGKTLDDALDAIAASFNA